MRKRTIAVFTGNRAEYGLQYPILQAIDSNPELDYKLIVSGAHLDPRFGETLKEIKSDGFRIDAQVNIEMDSKSAFATTQAIGSGISAISRAFAELKPDINIVYADRFEGLAAVIASSQMNIPTAHIEGGDLTEGGALDDSVRHAMTKLSHIHFTTNEQATNRVLGLGEEAWRVHTVGFPAIDLISKGNYATAEQIINAYGLDINRPIVLFTQHSVTTEVNQAATQIMPSLGALKDIAEEGCQVIVTYPNNDAGGQQIIEKIQEFDEQCINNVQVHRSLGRYDYHGILALSRISNARIACVGNSSSGIKETPAFGCPTVDIGTRQQGRLRGANVISTSYNQKAIYNAINTCLFEESFRKQCSSAENPYWLGGASTKITKVLGSVPLGQRLLRKKMTLVGETDKGWFR